MLQADKGFKSAKEIKQTFERAQVKLDGVSAHCPFWVHTTAWTSSPSIRPFIPAEVARKPPEQIEKWAEDYLLGLLDLCAELNVKIVQYKTQIDDADWIDLNRDVVASGFTASKADSTVESPKQRFYRVIELP